jgi:hypothetical protein
VVISGNDETVGLARIDCGELFVTGDEVESAAAWQLSVDPAEHQALTNALAGCPPEGASR